MVRQLVKTISDNRSWFLLATLFFVGGIYLMYGTISSEPELMTVLEETSLPMLRELSEQVFGGHPLRGAAILFLNNAFATLQVILLGLLLGIPPLFSSIANGAILGTVAFQLTQQGIRPLPFLLAGILPHGILELPAFLLSVALGLKLGYHVVFPLPGQSRRQSLGGIFQEIGNVLPMIFLLLATAALLEVFVTPVVMKLFFPQSL
jgi:stage II sporulation protein M